MIAKSAGVSRRRALKLAAASTALPLVHIRTGRAAGKLSVGFWDHWVPEGNAIMAKQCAAFGAAHQVEVQADFITSVGAKNLLTIAAEAQARTGHDIQQFPGWEVQNHADTIEPIDDVMKRLTAKYGPVADAEQVFVHHERPLARGAGQLRQSEQGAVRPHFRPEGGCRAGHREDVSGIGRSHAGG